MPRRSFLRPISFIRKHLVATIVLILALIVTGGLNYWIYTTNVAAVEQTEANTRAFIADANKKIAEFKAIKKAAEEKAKQEAAAKATAEQVLNTPESSSGSIDASSCNVSKTHKNPASIDVMVNKKHCIQPLNFAPGDLVEVYGATLSAKAKDAFVSMYEAAQAAGQGFSISSSYRSYSTQVATYNYWVGVSGREGADTYSARPGYSEHQTGLAFDVAAGNCALDCFGNTSQYQWLQAHAAEYGFIQRYYAGYDSITGYKAEEWHYRYVGTAVAQDMKVKGIKTLEEYWKLPGGTY